MGLTRLARMAEFIYTLRKARKAHGDKVVLDDVTLAFLPGAKIGVVGPNGAGKTTLLRAITGLNKLTGGSVTFDGQSVGNLPPDRIVDLGMAHVPQGKQLFPHLTVAQNLRLGAYLRAGTENPKLVEAFGVNVPMMVMLTYGFGVALAGLAGVLAAPVINVTPLMGSNLIIVVFAVVVIGGMGSIMGSIITGLGLGVLEGLTKVFYPELSATVVFIIMAIVLLIRPAGLFGREK